MTIDTRISQKPNTSSSVSKKSRALKKPSPIDERISNLQEYIEQSQAYARVKKPFDKEVQAHLDSTYKNIVSYNKSFRPEEKNQYIQNLDNHCVKTYLEYAMRADLKDSL